MRTRSTSLIFITIFVLIIFLTAELSVPGYSNSFNSNFQLNNESVSRKYPTNPKTSSPLEIINDEIKTNIEDPLAKLSKSLRTYLETNTLPENVEKNRIIVWSRSNNLDIETKLPPVHIGGNYLYFAEYETKKDLMNLAFASDVQLIMADTKIDFSSETEIQTSVTNIEKESFFINDLIGTKRVWNEFNVTGEGVTVGIMDTGVDFGISDLANSPVLLPSGITASFDPTGASLGFGTLRLAPVIENGIEFLPLEGRNITFWMGEETNVGNSAQIGLALQNLEITDISRKSVSGNYSIGIFYEPGFQETVPTQYFIFILVDSTIRGVYDTMYIDFSTSLAISLARDGVILESGETYLRYADWSLNDEDPIGAFNPIAARDLDGDGINDVSAGGLATTWDRFGLYNGQLIEGIDPFGNAVSLMYDPVGHGTLVASALASRGNSDIALFDLKDTLEIENGTGYKLRGSSPGANIIVSKGLAISDYILGWLWTAGLEPDFQVGGWVENDVHRVDISSNSWGTAQPAEDGELKGFDFNSLFLDLLSTPDLLYENYPGVIFIVASGNGGSGYGSLATPGSASMAITVGASNSYHFLGDFGGNNDVAWFSGRGPSAYGAAKPDVVAPGNTGYVHYPLITGFGNGSRAGGLFGGTSESTPRAAGVVALIYQMMVNRGQTPNLGSIRLLLKGNAIDLGFGPSSQGAGLVNAYESISSLAGSDKVILSSKFQSEYVGGLLSLAFGKFFVDAGGSPLDHPLLTDPQDDVVTMASPEMLAGGIELSAIFGNGTLVDTSLFDIEIDRLQLVDADRFSMTSSSGEGTTVGLEDLWSFSNMPNWRDADLLQISLSLTEPSWDNLFQFGYSIPDILLFDSSTNDLVYDEISQRTYVQQLYSGNPSQDFVGAPTVNFTDPGYRDGIPGWDGITYDGYVQLFENVKWDKISISELQNSISLDAVLANEYQIASIRIMSNSLNYSNYRVPLIIPAIQQVGYGDNVAFVGNDLDIEQPYDQNSVYGVFDLNYRPESGDSRFYSFEVPNNATFLIIQASWDEPDFMAHLFLFNESGQLELTSDVTYIGGGTYTGTTTDENSQNLIVPITSSVYHLRIHVTETPFRGDRFDLKVQARYLTISELPTPNPTFSQDLNGSLEGDLMIDASNYTISEFPEIEIKQLQIEMLQGQEGTVDDFIAIDRVINGTPNLPSELEKSYELFFEKGEKVELALTWDSADDLDFYVFAPGQSERLDQDLLFFQGTTPRNKSQIAKFSAPVTGTYRISIDYYDGITYKWFSEGNFTTTELLYRFEWNSFKGPTIVSETSSFNLDTSIFANGEYLMNLTMLSNFRFPPNGNLQFFNIEIINLLNHFNFTSNLISPRPGQVSGDVVVEWEADKPIFGSVFLNVAGIEHIIVRDFVENSLVFDSTLYANGMAILTVILTDRSFSHQYKVDIILDNSEVSTIPTLKTQNEKSLNVSLFPLIFGIGLIVIFERKRKLLNSK